MESAAGDVTNSPSFFWELAGTLLLVTAIVAVVVVSFAPFFPPWLRVVTICLFLLLALVVPVLAQGRGLLSSRRSLRFRGHMAEVTSLKAAVMVLYVVGISGSVVALISGANRGWSIFFCVLSGWFLFDGLPPELKSGLRRRA